jgi:hypothetical protein
VHARHIAHPQRCRPLADLSGQLGVLGVRKERFDGNDVVERDLVSFFIPDEGAAKCAVRGADEVLRGALQPAGTFLAQLAAICLDRIDHCVDCGKRLSAATTEPLRAR